LKVSSSNLLLLLDDLLTTYALGEQKEHDRQEPLDVKAILLEQLEEVKYLASLSGKQIKLETDEYLPEITINRANFLRIITNLIHNAIKFGKRDTVIEVVLKTENNLLKCLISNVTEGLDELSDKSVFTRFARATKDAQHPHSSGLGLYLTRKIVESMGGSIEAEIEGSERIRFSVTIPLL
ncbi:MAG: sensor histidine kinase, partial [Candidatus Obscuribacterales bacterium]|nr:sensor histidine kinase [Candidatus Obscuribacterales bacterium]